MCSNSRLLLHKKISQVLQNGKPCNSNTVAKRLKLKLEKNNSKFSFELPLRSKHYDIREEVPNLLKNECDILERIEINKDNSMILDFQVHRDYYIKGLLDSLRHKVNPPDIMCQNPDNVIVEFSSPNIAKPFHVGHLRSTIIGNYIANINNFLKNNVKRINYLGDWGTQFGFVQLGLSLAKISEETLKKNPMNALYNAYVYANKLAEADSTIADQARQIFKKLESGDKSCFSEWESFRKYTLEELEGTYSRIGVKFDHYEWESMYSITEISNIISEMERLNLIAIDDEKRKVVHLNENRIVPIIKSDGSSLYITRDIAAAINRFEKYKFDTMYYVVGNAQSDHFLNLIGILNAMKLPWANKLKHIKFGKIDGMSTRKGTAVFLQDILDETRAVMKEKQIQSPNTKVNLDYDHPSTEILGVSAVIINDLKQKRNQNYQFDWNKALDIRGETGVKLQYTHSRLVSLEEKSGATIASECIPSLLTEPAAENLIYVIGQFDEAVINSYEELEPYILVKYLFKLSQAANRVLKELRVKGEPVELANQRLLLTHTARKVLAQGMKLLGLTPLDRM